jgi:hypothetical protein
MTITNDELGMMCEERLLGGTQETQENDNS